MIVLEKNSKRLFFKLLLRLIRSWSEPILGIALDEERLTITGNDGGRWRFTLVRIIEENANWIWRLSRTCVDLVINIHGRRHELHCRFKRKTVELHRNQFPLQSGSDKNRHLEPFRQCICHLRQFGFFSLQSEIQNGFSLDRQSEGGFWRDLTIFRFCCIELGIRRL